MTKDATQQLKIMHVAQIADCIATEQRTNVIVSPWLCNSIVIIASKQRDKQSKPPQNAPQNFIIKRLFPYILEGKGLFKYISCSTNRSHVIFAPTRNFKISFFVLTRGVNYAGYSPPRPFPAKAPIYTNTELETSCRFKRIKFK